MEQNNKGYVYAPIPYKGDIMSHKLEKHKDTRTRCKCGKSKDDEGLCDGSHKNIKTDETK